MCAVPITVPSAIRVGISVLKITAIRTIPAAKIPFRQFDFHFFHSSLLLMGLFLNTFVYQAMFLFEPYNRFTLYIGLPVFQASTECIHLYLWNNNGKIQPRDRFGNCLHNPFDICTVCVGKRFRILRMCMEHT